MTSSAASPRITPNLFGIAFGLTGLGEVWATAAHLYDVPAQVAYAIFVVSAVVWAVTLVRYVEHVATTGRWRTELLDPVFAPFVALIGIVPMLLGVALSPRAHVVGEVVVIVSLVSTLALGGALMGQWIVSDLTLAQWHPGYFLPTVAGGYLGAGALAALGHDDLAHALFGYGTVSWLVLGSILLQRTFVEQRLPAPLVPTMAIQMAPPVVAGTAWFEINGGRVDALALGLVGYALLMAMVQIRLVPVFRAASFGPGWWSFSFSYAAVFVDALHWMAAEDVVHGTAWAGLLLAVVTVGIGALAIRTVVALRRGRFLPVPPRVVPAVPQVPQVSQISTLTTQDKEHVA
jgi:tellurite resistance protein